METTRLRNYLYVFGLPLLWWGAVSLSGPLTSYPSLAGELEFLPIAMHSSHDADYSVDAYGIMIAPVDLSIIKDAIEDRLATQSPSENLLSNLQVQTSEPQTSESRTNSSGEELVNVSTDIADNPLPTDTSGEDQTGDSGSDDSNTDSGTDDESNSPGNSAGKGNGKEKDNNGQQNNGNGNGSGNDNANGKGNKSTNA